MLQLQMLIQLPLFLHYHMAHMRVCVYTVYGVTRSGRKTLDPKLYIVSKDKKKPFQYVGETTKLSLCFDHCLFRFFCYPRQQISDRLKLSDYH